MTANNVLPHLSLLNTEQKEQVHRYALKILAETGVRIDSDRVQKLLERKLGPGWVDSARVRFPAEVVEWALKSAPANLQIFDRTGNQAFQLADSRTHFGVGVTALYYQDPRSDQLTPFSRANMRDMVRLGSALPHYEVISTVGVVQDVPARLSDLYGSLEMIANTTRPLVLLASDEANFPPILEMFEHLVGDLGEKPFILPYFNPVSPLVLNTGTLEKMQAAIQRGLPVIFSNYSMAGASTPITPAGTLALLLAELLAGLIVSQFLREGAPILLGMLPVYFDMKTMVNFYDPQSLLINLACAEMLAYYNLPHCGTSGSGTGWGADLIAADTYWMNTLTYSLTRGGLAPFVGDTLTSKAISPLTLVYVHEIIEQTRRFVAGFQLDDQMAVLSEIEKVGPGGSFLSAPSTRQRFKNGYYASPVFPHYSMEKWQAVGQPSAGQVLRDNTLRLLETAPIPADHDDLLARGEAFIDRHAARP
jgi:trimethylamine--corrinoid protein Co-methyltransferase